MCGLRKRYVLDCVPRQKQPTTPRWPTRPPPLRARHQQSFHWNWNSNEVKCSDAVPLSEMNIFSSLILFHLNPYPKLYILRGHLISLWLTAKFPWDLGRDHSFRERFVTSCCQIKMRKTSIMKSFHIQTSWRNIPTPTPGGKRQSVGRTKKAVTYLTPDSSNSSPTFLVPVRYSADCMHAVK